MVGRVAFVALVGLSEMLCALSNSIRQRIQDRIHEIADRFVVAFTTALFGAM
jgi:hypothetical protein